MWWWLAFLAAPTPGAEDVIRQVLTRRGCDAAVCHGSSPGTRLRITPSTPLAVDPWVNPADPEASALVQKAFGRLGHRGGKNLEPESCDARRLVAWIAHAPLPACPAPDAPFEAVVWPAFGVLGCSSCHGPGGEAQAALDLATPADARAALHRLEPVPEATWRSPMVAVLDGHRPGHPHLDRAPEAAQRCAEATLYRWLAGAPTPPCPPEPPAADTLASVVLPGLQRRGCVELTCHGGGAGGLSLFEPHTAEALRHDQWILSAHGPGLLAIPRNEAPHGGGRRLGGPGDCVDDALAAWLTGQVAAPCRTPPPPDEAQFATVVQPLLDQMTCSQAKCHGGGLPVFELKAPVSAEAIAANYRETLKFVDPDFAPLSPVLLRVHDGCAYRRLTAWIERQPIPVCTPGPPDPTLFPKMGP